MSEVAKRPKAEAEAPELSPELVQRFAQMAMAIPEDDGRATERIVEQILGAATVDQLDAPWDVTKAQKLAGALMRVDWIKRQQSSFAGGLGVFLVVGYTDLNTGESAVFTTGSVSVVAQLVRAFMIGGCPIYCEMVIAERESANGYRPHHLKMFSAPAGA